MLYVRLMIKVKVGIPKSFKVGWYPYKITGSHLKSNKNKQFIIIKRILNLFKSRAIKGSTIITLFKSMALALLHIKLDKKIPKKDRREKEKASIKIFMLCGQYLELHTIKWAAYTSFNLFVLLCFFFYSSYLAQRQLENLKMFLEAFIHFIT